MKFNLPVNWRFPNRWELGLFVLGIIFFMAFDYAQNGYQIPGVDFSDPSIVFGMPFITLFWIGFAGYVIILIVAITRAILRRTTHVYLDLFFGMLMTVGLYALTAGGIAAGYFAQTEAIPWIFNLAQINFYHIFGVLTQIVGAVWFFVSD